MSKRSGIHRRDFLAHAGKAALGVTATASVGPLVSSAGAQERFPAREINWIIYQAPGGSIDTTARIIQHYLENAGLKTTPAYVLGAGGPAARPQVQPPMAACYTIISATAPRGANDLKAGL